MGRGGFSVYRIMSSVKTESFTSFNLDAFYFFFFVIFLARTSSIVLNRNSEVCCPCLVADVKLWWEWWGQGSFQCFIFELAVGFFIYAFNNFEDFLKIPSLSCVYHEGTLDFVKGFFLCHLR